MKRIILIGYMGAGKTTIGKVLAREMGLEFYDLDNYIEDRFHQKIPDIFAAKGEEGFREVEKKMLHEVAEFENVIISCGGGTPCFFDNMDYMNTRGETIFLDAPPQVLKEHLQMGKTVRPLIQGKTEEELIAYIEESLQKRLPYYQKAKHILPIEVIHTKEQIKNYVNQIIGGVNYFRINDKGNVAVTPRKDGVEVDLKEVMDDLALRDVSAPVLVRFPDIIDNRIEKTSTCFKKAANEYGYNGGNFIIYPIKVNQISPVVEEVIKHGKKFNLGLEAGSKPELHAVLAVNMNSDSLIICNGYKDQDYIELALLAQKMGKRIFIVVEKFKIWASASSWRHQVLASGKRVVEMPASLV